MKFQNDPRLWAATICGALLLLSGAGMAQTHQDIHLSNGNLLRVPLSAIDSMGFYADGYAIPLTVVTGSASLVGATSAQVGGNLLSGGPSERGVCWSTVPVPTVADNTSSAGSGSGIYSCSLADLLANTTYHVRAYATNTVGTFYGDEVMFTTDTALFQPGGGISDIEGYAYATIVIGGREWMAENLRTVTFANGDPIPLKQLDSPWMSTTAPAYCIFNNYASVAAVHGMLYNGYAVVDPRNVCPAGWHVATDLEILELVHTIDTAYQIGGDVSPRAGGMMKATGGVAWEYPNTGASDVSGFHALGSGYRNGGNAAFWRLYEQTYFWGVSADVPGLIFYYAMFNDAGRFKMTDLYPPSVAGYSVRCVAD